MIRKNGLKLFGMACVCSAALFMNPMSARADEAQGNAVSSAAAVKVEAQNVTLYAEQDKQSAVIGQASQGTVFDVVEMGENGWIKVASEDGMEGYLMAEGNAAVVETTEQTVTEEDVRQDVVDYALTFLGNPYVYGGSDPNTGADCSGFTSYVLENAAGVDMNRSSRSQATQGTAVSAEQIQPGDLVFYASGSRINHVGLYIGDGQIVHASTPKTGIKISPWTYRNPVKIVDVIG